MTTNPLQILCWDYDSEYARLVASVFSLIPHKLHRVVEGEDEFWRMVRQNQFDLIVIDNTIAGLQASDVNAITSDSTASEVILIAEDYKQAGAFHEKGNIHLLAKEDVVVKLAPLLSEIYSHVSDKIYNGINFQKLLQQGLEQLNCMVLIVNSAGRVLFMNQAASKILTIENVRNSEVFIQNILADGAKIWKFAQDYLHENNKPLQNYQLHFIDGHDQKHSKQMNFSYITAEKNYILIDETNRQKTGPSINEEPDLSIIQRFSESISNELLNPVNVIFGRIQLLKQSMSQEPSVKKHIDGLEKQVERINETIRRLVTFASLRPDTVPQKVHLNEVMERLENDPAMRSRLKSFMERISFKPSKNLPVLHGLLSHFDMLIQSILEMIFECTGPSGKVEVRTGEATTEENSNQVVLSFYVDYNKPVFGDSRSLSNQLKEERTLEASIIKYIIKSYSGTYRIKTADSQSEKLEIFFPVLDPYNEAEAK